MQCESCVQRAYGLGVKIKYTHLFKIIGPNQKPNQITVFLPVFNRLGHLTSKLFMYCHKVVPCFSDFRLFIRLPHLEFNLSNFPGISVVRAGAPEGPLCLRVAALTVQRAGTESPAVVDPQGDRLHRVSEGECYLRKSLSASSSKFRDGISSKGIFRWR